jgi:methionine aminotransferase
MREGLNQYPPMAGVPRCAGGVAQDRGAVRPPLRRRARDHRHRRRDAGHPHRVLCCVHPGDEVIVLEPCYDSYAPNIELAGGRIVRVPLTPAPSARTSRASPRRSRRARA